ncbi:hypothetical protein FQA39_LY06621 [Lamprigera yunnana]|nr:hypothetical protein FQA39_LY06621 [Lamprigera yunnana]
MVISAEKTKCMTTSKEPLRCKLEVERQKSQNPQLSSNSHNGFETHTPVASTSGIDLHPNSHVAETTFEVLLLSEIKQKYKNDKETRKRICRGAEVITASEKPYESKNTNETTHVETSDTNNVRTVNKRNVRHQSVTYESDKSDLGTLEDSSRV